MCERAADCTIQVERQVDIGDVRIRGRIGNNAKEIYGRSYKNFEEIWPQR
jgi:hypothetical protein